MVNVVDILQCRDGLPLDREVLKGISAGGRAFATSRGWEPLVELFKASEQAPR